LNSFSIQVCWSITNSGNRYDQCWGAPPGWTRVQDARTS
jgi:hypothetical protein